MVHGETYTPRYLYRYRSLPGSDSPYSHREVERRWQHEIASLTKPYLWCANFKSMNDPMEGTYQANSRIKRHSQYNEIKQKILAGKVSLGICSFSETKNNGPMWAHYADEFNGICIQYDSRFLFGHTESELDQNKSLVRITYSEDRYELSQTDTQEKDEVAIAREILSFKSHRWLYEQEWRLFKGAVGEYRIPDKCIFHIYIGNRMAQAEVDRLRNALLAKSIPMSQVQLSGYSIRFKKMHNHPSLLDQS